MSRRSGQPSGAGASGAGPSATGASRRAKRGCGQRDRGQRDRELVDRTAGAPVDAGRVPGHERLVDQVPAQGAVIVEDRLEDLADRGFCVPAAGLERLGRLVKQQAATIALGRTAVILPSRMNARSWSGGSARRPSAL